MPNKKISQLPAMPSSLFDQDEDFFVTQQGGYYPTFKSKIKTTTNKVVEVGGINLHEKVKFIKDIDFTKNGSTRYTYDLKPYGLPENANAAYLRFEQNGVAAFFNGPSLWFYSYINSTHPNGHLFEYHYHAKGMTQRIDQNVWVPCSGGNIYIMWVNVLFYREGYTKMYLKGHS